MATNITHALYTANTYVSLDVNSSTLSSFSSSSSNNGTNSFGRFETVFISLVLIAIIVGTVVGNILVCLAVCLVRKLRRPCNYLLVSLAVSDLCVALLVMPMAMFYEIYGRWIFGDILCNVWVSFDVLSCTASIVNLCMISVDRYYAITKPLEYGVRRTPKRMIMWVIVVWCFAACISLPPLLIIGNEHSERLQDGTVNYEVCLVSQDFGYQLYATLCSFYIPLTVMITVYYKIFRAARKIVMDEKRAQSHLEPIATHHFYMPIVQQRPGRMLSDGLVEDSNISDSNSSPAHQLHPNNHRHSSTSTNTMCSLDKVRLKPRATSHESQCPIMMYSSGKSSSVKEMNNLGASLNSRYRRSTQHQHPQQQQMRTPTQSTNHKKLRFHLARERKASTTLGIIMSAFICCWLPFFVLALARPFLETTNNAVKLLGSVFLWLGYANSLLNPIIYATLNRDFRVPFQAILYCRCSSLNDIMREEFYHSQYGDPEQPISGKCHLDYEDGVGVVEYAVETAATPTPHSGEDVRLPRLSTAHESFL